MKNTKHFLVLAILLFLSLLFHRKDLNEFPSGIHAWAQADRYALALGFERNGLNFFKPETYVLNHQFPGDWKVPSKESTTAVDFPIHDFIPTIIMKISGAKSIWIFRLYILLYSIVGLFFLYQLTYLLTSEISKSIFVLVFAASSPVFIYYQSGFLPTIPSLANALIGLYFYTKYIRGNTNRYFALSILFLTLATLSRTTFAIPLIAIFGLEFLRILKTYSSLLPKIIPVTLSVASVLSYYFYNDYLRNTNGSIFLNHFMPPGNFQEFKHLLLFTKDQWLYHYFTLEQIIIFSIIMLWSFAYILIKKPKKRPDLLVLLFLFVIIMFGCLLFTVLMAGQFPAHDYYFLDTYFLPLLLLLILVISTIPSGKTKAYRLISVVFLIAVTIPLVSGGLNLHAKRSGESSSGIIDLTSRNFKGANKILDSLNVDAGARILVLDAYAPNIPLILMDRKGYAIMSTTKQNLQSALNWDFDLIVYQNEFFYSDIYLNYPEIIQNLNRIHDTGKITFCTYSKSSKNQKLTDFFGLEDIEPGFKTSISFEEKEVPLSNWSNIKFTDQFHYNGSYAGVIDSSMTYGLTFKSTQIPLLKQKQSLLYVNGYFFKQSEGSCFITVTLEQNGEEIYYANTNLNSEIKDMKVWQKLERVYYLPHVKHTDYQIAIYIWNRDQTDYIIDDFSFEIY